MSDALDAEIRRISRECLGLRVRMLSRALTQYYDDALRPLDLKIGQFDILLAAAQAETLLPRELCETLHVDPSTMSRNLERMSARGWIETVAARDGRKQPFRLTAAGRTLLEQALPLWRIAQEQAEQLLGEMGTALLRDAAKRLGRATAPVAAAEPVSKEKGNRKSR